MLSDVQIKNIEDAGNIIFATSSKDGNPRCVVITPSRVEKNRIIICNIQMNKTFENIIENKQCFVNVYMPDKDDLQYKIEGEAEIITKGSLFEEIKNYEENENGLIEYGLTVKSVIIINVKTIMESKG